ncbi:hypothetical protein Dimus_039781 [Dionaea muscipula]
MGLHIEEARCIIDEDDFFHVKNAFPEAYGVTYFKPSSFDTVMNFEENEALAVHLDHFRNGLRFPLHPFILEVLKGFGMLPAWLTPESIGYIISFLIRALESDLTPSLPAFQTVFQLCRKNTNYFCLKPRPGYQLVYISESYDSWKEKFILVSSDDWHEFQPFVFPKDLSPIHSRFLTDNDKWMLAICDGGVDTIPCFHEVVTLENLENHQIATAHHPADFWDEMRALFGESYYSNGHPTFYEMSSTEEEDEDEEEDEADNEASDDEEEEESD